jgi:transcriptional regulator with XRE-family HTH domain
MAQEAHQVTPENQKQVESLSARGVTQVDIGLMLGISKPTLEKYYNNELQLGTAKANAQIAGALYNKAISGDTTSMIFWLKCRAGWKEKIVIEGDGDNPLQVVLHEGQQAKHRLAQILTSVASASVAEQSE